MNKKMPGHGKKLEEARHEQSLCGWCGDWKKEGSRQTRIMEVTHLVHAGPGHCDFVSEKACSFIH